MNATKAQLDYIESIEEFVDEKFTGKTKEEAQLYISRNVDEYKLSSLSNWHYSNGYF